MIRRGLTMSLVKTGRMLPLLILWLLVTFTPLTDAVCLFKEKTAECSETLAGDPVSVTATLNECNNPVDITFHITLGNVSWSHTFANEDEVQQMETLPDYTGLRVQLKHGSHNTYHVQANFLLDQGALGYFLDDSLAAASNCFFTGNLNSLIPLVVFILLLVLIAAGITMMLLWRRHRCTKPRKSELLSDMGAAPTSHPYQEEPTSAHPDARHTNTTVIKNTIYRDSLLSADGESLPPILEEEGAVGNSETPIGNGGAKAKVSSPKKHKSKHKSKRKEKGERCKYRDLSKGEEEVAEMGKGGYLDDNVTFTAVKEPPLTTRQA